MLYHYRTIIHVCVAQGTMEHCVAAFNREVLTQVVDLSMSCTGANRKIERLCERRRTCKKENMVNV